MAPALALFPSRRSPISLLAMAAAVLFLTLAAVTAEAQTAAPGVSGVAVVSDAGDDDAYMLGDVIRIQVTFSAAVEVTGTPRLAIDMDPADWGQKWANFESGSGTTNLTFTHTVVEPNLSTHGIAVLANTLELNGGTIASATGAADLSHGGLGHDANHKVDWQLAGAAAAVTGVAVVSDAGDDHTYVREDVIRIQVTFSEAVTVTDTPRLAIDMDPADWGQKWANYESGSGTTSLTFAHMVVEPNLSTQGIAVLANTLELNGGTIASAAGAADLSHDGLAHDASHKVDWQMAPAPQAVPAAVTGVTVVSDAGDDATYARGDVIRIRVTFSAAVDVSGTPRLKIKMDPSYGEFWADYEGGSGATALTFAHTVVEPNFSTQGIAVLANTLELNGGTIASAAGAADLSHDGLGHDASHKVDWQLAPAAPTPGSGPTIEWERRDSHGSDGGSAATVPADCTITVTAVADEPRGVSVSWTNAGGGQKGCESGGIQAQWKKTTSTAWLSTPTVSNRDEGLKGVKFGQLDAWAQYDFRIVATDAQGTTRASNTAAVIVLENPATDVLGRPVSVQARGNNSNDIMVWWVASPAPAGKSITGYRVEWKTPGGSYSSTASYDVDNTARYLLVRGAYKSNGTPVPSGKALTVDTTYVVRVVAKLSDGTNTSEEASEEQTVTTWTEPLKAWFIDDTPNYNSALARIFMMIDSNKREASGNCYINSGVINCPPRTLVNLNYYSTWGVITIEESATLATETARNHGSHVGNPRGPQYPKGIWASGGNGNIVVRWLKAEPGPSTFVATGHPAVGGHIVQHRTWKDVTLYTETGTKQSIKGWTAWADVAEVGADDLSYTITGVEDGRHQVRVVGVVFGDHDTNSGTDAKRFSGISTEPVTVWTDESYTDTPGPVVGATVSGGGGAITVSWDPPTETATSLRSDRKDSDDAVYDPGVSLVHGYTVRYKPLSTNGWVETEHYSRDTLRKCTSSGCTNPRTLKLTGLTAGARYTVEIRAINANGPGEWLTVASDVIA